VPPLWTDTVKPYYEQDGITIYHADCVEVLPELSELGALITDPPYSSGGQFRGDRTRSTVEKYVQSGTMAYRPEFAGDNRDQRSFLIWAGLWMGAARMASIVGRCRVVSGRRVGIETSAVVQKREMRGRRTAISVLRFT